MDSIKAKIEDMISQNATDFEIAKIIKEELNSYYKTLPESFLKSNGKAFLLKHTRKIDNLIKLVYRVATREMFFDYFPTKNAIPLTIAALGSYGREQLSPHSDIDIMFSYKDIKGYNVKALIEKMLYLLWDSGLKLGHRVHEVGELKSVANSDITIKTALIESRFIEGSKYLWVEVENAIRHIKKTNQREFIIKKIEERRRLRKKYPLMMEPNIKEGVGGFRDANIVFWIGRLLHNIPKIEELPRDILNPKHYSEFRASLDFLFRVRTALHLVTNKKVDQLRLEHIPEVAGMLNYKTNRGHLIFTKKVHKSLRVIWLYSRMWLYSLSAPYTSLYEEYLKPKQKLNSLSETLEFLIKNASSNFQSHPDLNRVFLDLKESSTEFDKSLILKIFEQRYSSAILQALSEVNMLGLFIPPLKKVEAWPQFDGYHKYPVDLHLIETVKALEDIEDIRVAEVFNELEPKYKSLIKLVALLHDSGKGRVSDHHQVGAIIFKAYGAKIGLDRDLVKLGEKLIRYHSELSKVVQQEDIYSPKAIAKFAALFPTKLELDLIYILTYADTTAVGNGIYNEFSARLFYTLYLNSIEFLKHKEYLDETSKRVKRSKVIEKSKEFKALPKTMQRKILSIESNLPFIKYSKDKIFDIVKRAFGLKDDYIYEIKNRDFLTIEIIRKKKIDLGYLLAKLNHLNIINLDIVRLFNGKKYFKIDFNQNVDDEFLDEIEFIIKESFKKQDRINLPKPKIQKENIKIDCSHSTDYALMQVKTKDKKGLLAFIMNLFEYLNIEIVSAKTYAIKSVAYDTFLIDKNGNFCNNIELIYQELTSN